MTSTDILQKLESASKDIAAFCKGLSDEVFFSGSDERWGPAHHLAHLTFTHKRVAKGFNAKDRLPSYSVKPKTYEEVKANYLAALQSGSSAGFLTNNPFASKPESDKKDTVISAFLATTQKLREAIATWSENDLNIKGMQHPLMGDLSTKEMLLFMIYHDQHHLLGIQKHVKE
ncbi:MAG: DinB family protein [Trueperaceae bacterium]